MAVTDLNTIGIQRLQAAAIDGRCRNVRYRQKQLKALYDGIRNKEVELRAAITRDNQFSSPEVEAELCMTIDIIRHFHKVLDFDKFLKEESLVAAGKDSLGRRSALGVVIIRPSNYTRLYSILAAITPAIAAGNCVVLELLDSSLEVDSILKELLPEVLDHDTFFVSTSENSDQELASCTLVDQTGSISPAAAGSAVISSPNNRTIAIVDRTANIDVTARAIVSARFRFHGASPYAPDLVIVNEFVKKDFLEASLKYASKHFAMKDVPYKSSSSERETTLRIIQEGESQEHLSTFRSSNFMLVNISNRNATITKAKISGPYLPIASCTSITDVVLSQNPDEIFLAAYFFGSPEAANFMSQNLNCHIAWINQIPSHILIGPAAPISCASNPTYRYDTKTFSVSRPQYIEPPSENFRLVSKLLEDSDQATLHQVRSQPIAPLNSQKQPPGHAIGFFEQGIITGMGIALSVVVPVVGYGIYLIGRKGFELVLHKRR